MLHESNAHFSGAAAAGLQRTAPEILGPQPSPLKQPSPQATQQQGLAEASTAPDEATPSELNGAQGPSPGSPTLQLRPEGVSSAAAAPATVPDGPRAPAADSAAGPKPSSNTHLPSTGSLR